jgi:hypothetical protein
MSLPLKSLCLLLTMTVIAGAQESVEPPASPEVDAFAGKLTGITYELRGTNNLKRLRFDGEAMCPVRPDGTAQSRYETSIPDVGAVRILFQNDTTGWYFFSDDLKFVTPLRIKSERTLALPEGAPAKPVRQFPQDIEGVEFVSTDGDSSRVPGKICWKGGNLEISALQDQVWKTESRRSVIANRRVFETPASDTAALWFVYSADGKKAWLLEVENLFGGQRSDVPVNANVTVETSGLSEQDNDLANHLFDLATDGDVVLARTLFRQFERRLSKRPDLLEKLTRRLDEN